MPLQLRTRQASVICRCTVCAVSGFTVGGTPGKTITSRSAVAHKKADDERDRDFRIRQHLATEAEDKKRARKRLKTASEVTPIPSTSSALQESSSEAIRLQFQAGDDCE